MKWASSLELTEDLSEEIPEETLAQLPDCGEDATLRSALRLCHSLAGTLSFKLGGNPDLLLLFVSPEYREKLEPIGR